MDWVIFEQPRSTPVGFGPELNMQFSLFIKKSPFKNGDF